MSTIDITPQHQIKAAVDYKVYQCNDCHGFFFIPNDKKTKVEKAAPNHTWSHNNPTQLRHLIKEEREQRVNISFHPLLSTTTKIIKALTEKPNLNVTEIRKKTALSSRTLNKALKKLEVNKVVKHQWYGKSKRFTVDKKESEVFLANEENLLYIRRRRHQSTF